METWKDIPNVKGYQVSDDGRMRSLDRAVESMREGKKYLCHYRGKILKLSTCGSGYNQVCCKGKSYYVHRLVLSVFDRSPNPGEQGLHFDDVKTNNSLSNLRWGTREDNNLDAMRNEVHASGESHTNSKLTWLKVDRIRKLYNSGSIQVMIANEFGVSQKTIGNIINKKTWKN